MKTKLILFFFGQPVFLHLLLLKLGNLFVKLTFLHLVKKVIVPWMILQVDFFFRIKLRVFHVEFVLEVCCPAVVNHINWNVENSG